MNIMLTSAGRRGYMVQYFKKVLKGKGKVYVGNCDEDVTSFLYADQAVVTPFIYDDDYINFLLDYCLKESITVIIPLFDIDLYILSKNKKIFEAKGIHIIVSDVSIIEICNDKWKTKNYLERQHILVPKTFLTIDDALKAVLDQEINFPIIIKPRWGMGSIAVYEANNMNELRVLFNKARRQIGSTYLKYESGQDFENCILFQEKVVGQEYGADIINDLEGNYQSTIVKVKQSMRAGETDVAITVDNELIEGLCIKIGRNLRHIGNLDIDLILTEDGKLYVLDLNARFGGGYPFSHCAGVNLPKAIIAWLMEDKVERELLLPRKNVRGYKDIGVISTAQNCNSQ